MAEWFFERLTDLLERRYRLVLALLALVTVGSLAALPWLRFDFTPQALFAGNEDLLARSQAAKERFGHDDAVVLLVVEATEGGSVLELGPLRWLDATATAIHDTGLVDSVTTLPGMDVPFIVKPRPIRLGLTPLLPYADFEEADLARVRAALAASPDLRARFVSGDARLGVAYVQLPPTSRSIDKMTEAVAAIERVLREQPPPDGFRARLTGLPPLRVAIVASLAGEQLRLLPLAGAVFLLVLAALFRSFVWAILPLVAVGLGVAWTGGVVSVSGHPVNLITNILPLLLFTLGTTNAVHVVARYADECELTPDDRLGAARRAVAHVGLAVFLCVLTTAAGFASLATSRAEVLKDVAWEAALGMGLLYVAIIALLGAVMGRLRPPSGRRAAEGSGRLQWVLARGADLVLRWPLPTVVSSLALIVVAAALARNVPVDSSMLEVYDDHHPETLLIRSVEANLGGFLALDLELRAEGGAGAGPAAVAATATSTEAAAATSTPPLASSRFLDEAVYLAVVELGRFALEDREVVLGATSYATILEGIRTGPLGKAGGAEADPPDQESIHEAAGAIEEVAESLGLRRYLDAEGRYARLQLRIRELGTRRTLAAIERIEARARELLPPESGVRFDFLGEGTVNARAMDRFVRDLFGSLLLACGLIFGLMTALLRSLRAGLCAALPNLTPLAVTLGYMGLRGYPMNAGNAIVFTISLGVAVDDTIHFLARALDEMRRGRSVDEAVRHAMEGAGRAMVMASLLVVVGLSVMLGSDFVPNRRFAELMAVTMTSALLGDLLLLPACVRLVWKRAR